MKHVKILLVEDNPGDVILTREALNEGKLFNEVDDVNDGEAALKYLFKEPPYEQVETPDIILLDINMPKVSGLEVLKRIKSDDNLKRIPTIMLTTSAAEKDIIESYNCYANAYLTKPVDYIDFLETVKLVGEFWVSLVNLPTGNKG